MKIKFCGATGRVTGSCYLLEAEGKKIVIDCGLFQGSSGDRGKNQEPFPFDPAKIDVVIATHSHIDHIGRIPKLYRDGFRGEIYSTKPARDLAKIFLEDTLNLMKGDARRDGPEKMIWMKEDLTQAMNSWIGYDYHEPFFIEDIKVEMLDAGHILGSAIVRITAEGKIIIFSGDLGNPPVPILEDTDFIEKADYVVMESTYGDRIHEESEFRTEKLANAMREIYERKGTLLIPAFAMERTQELLYEINALSLSKKTPDIPVFLDSPLAIKATDIYARYKNYFDKEAQYLINSGDDIFDFPGLFITKTAEESRKIRREKGPKIIIAGSGMSTGGRILTHEVNYLPDPRNMILFIGFQVKGTLGRRIKEGEKEIRIMGQDVRVEAEVKEISGYSAHADQKKLLYWLGKMCNTEQNKPKKVFITHGEPTVSDIFAQEARRQLGIDTIVPKEFEEIEL